jgi:hypothetical protein
MMAARQSLGFNDALGYFNDGGRDDLTGCAAVLKTVFRMSLQTAPIFDRVSGLVTSHDVASARVGQVISDCDVVVRPKDNERQLESERTFSMNNLCRYALSAGPFFLNRPLTSGYKHNKNRPCSFL